MAIQEIDKQALYGKFIEGQAWRQNLLKKATHKALDIAEEDVNINTSRTGISALGATGIAAVAGLPAALLAGFMLLRGAGTPAVPPTPPGPTDSNYVVRFFDRNGKLIDVPNIRERPKTD